MQSSTLKLTMSSVGRAALIACLSLIAPAINAMPLSLSPSGEGLRTGLQGPSTASVAADDCLNRSNFYINLFGGPWPVPNRYEIMNIDQSKPGGLRLASPGDDCLLANPACRERTGLIRIGKYTGTEGLIKRPPKAGSFTIKKEKIAGLEVEIFTWRTGASPSRVVQTVLIHDRHEFIIIADEDTELWQRMLRTHTEMINKIKKR